MFPCSLTDRKDESWFLERLCISEYSRFSNLDPCQRCLLLFVYDASLRALRAVSLAAMAESFLFCISILSFASCFDCCLKAWWYPKSIFLLVFVGIGLQCCTAVLTTLHSSTDSQIFSLVAKESAVSPSAK
jgi:hypothetical protein